MRIWSLMLLLVLPSLGWSMDAGQARVLGKWLDAHPDEKTWLDGSTEASPRAFVTLNENSVEVIIKLPGSVTPEQIVNTVLNYDVYKRTSDVEVSFQTARAFYTGTKIMGFHSPTITSNSHRIDGNTMRMDWHLMPEEQASDWWDANRGAFVKAMAKAGLDTDEDAVKDYLKTIKKKLDAVDSVVGSHEFVDGYYRYAQDLKLRSRILDAAARKLGKARQYEAALKAACYSTGMMDWAGPQGKPGRTFQTHGNVGSSVTPGK